LYYLDNFKALLNTPSIVSYISVGGGNCPLHFICASASSLDYGYTIGHANCNNSLNRTISTVLLINLQQVINRRLEVKNVHYICLNRFKKERNDKEIEYFHDFDDKRNHHREKYNEK
jgi:hypothetical protein